MDGDCGSCYSQIAFLEGDSGLWKVLGGDRILSEKDAVCRKSGERKLACQGGAPGHRESTVDRTGWLVGCGVREGPRLHQSP